MLDGKQNPSIVLSMPSLQNKPISDLSAHATTSDLHAWAKANYYSCEVAKNQRVVGFTTFVLKQHQHVFTHIIKSPEVL